MMLALGTSVSVNAQPTASGASGAPDVVKVVARQQVLDLTAKWDTNICFYTSKAHPITTLDNLKCHEVAFWGGELNDNARAFFVAANIQKKDGSLEWSNGPVQMYGVGNRVFTDDFLKHFPNDIPPKLFCTWASFENRRDDDGKLVLEGAIRVVFVAEKKE